MKNTIKLFGIMLVVMFGMVSLNKAQSLSGEEIKDLQYLSEEEKLARDVYLYAYDMYKIPIFNNISNSEQRHMNQVQGLLNKYNIEDLASDERGVFTNKDLQDLYTKLVEKVNVSLVEALKVGATIEDLDISDIDNNIERTSHKDIKSVYERLKCGSTNHMRAFSSQLKVQNVEYIPQYISNEEYLEIISSRNAPCGKQGRH